MAKWTKFESVLTVCSNVPPFKDNLLNGEIPSEMSALTELKELNLNQNNFFSFPTEIGRLKQLESLMIAANHLRNDLPSELGLLSHLRTLSLTFNNIPGPIPTELGRLEQLRGKIILSQAGQPSHKHYLSHTRYAFLSTDRIDLSFNAISGTVPTEIGELQRMSK